MTELPLWPPLAAIIFGVIGLAVLKYFSLRLDRADEAARNRQHLAE